MIAELFKDLPPVPPARERICTRKNYDLACEREYASDFALADALENWSEYQARRAEFAAWVAAFKKDCWLKVGNKCHNPEGTLWSLAWVMQESMDPTKHYLTPCLDFEPRHQKVFVRRGLVIYLKLLLGGMSQGNDRQGNGNGK